MKHLHSTLIAAASLCTLQAAAVSPYITEVYDYCPAPGQFVNISPLYAEGDDAEAMRGKALEAIGGTAGGTVSLGAFGGYITFGFDHTVANVKGQCDFTILGNSFFSGRSLKPEGGSSESGVILVSRDINGNGLPDDPWYEIAGSAHHDVATIKDYSITYTRPADGHQPVVTDPKGAYDDEQYIAWTDNQGASGYLGHLVVNANNYYPEWLDETTLTFSGTRLPGNAVLEGSRIKEWVLYPFAYGYADNMPNDDSRAAINLEWAVDNDGRPADLDGIDFVRVYTALNQQCGALGETSTEICGAVDLHPDASGINDISADNTQAVICDGHELRLLGFADGTTVNIYTIAGRQAHSLLTDGTITTARLPLSPGVYIVNAGNTTARIAIR
ncbi:MAG: T9SS type A sorting domain-containing protein [Bacteroidales bacterium]|nr:T9SS type A sorting domain-containing protein [Bacteroidales bacterium]